MYHSILANTIANMYTELMQTPATSSVSNIQPIIFLPTCSAGPSVHAHSQFDLHAWPMANSEGGVHRRHQVQRHVSNLPHVTLAVKFG